MDEILQWMLDRGYSGLQLTIERRDSGNGTSFRILADLKPTPTSECTRGEVTIPQSLVKGGLAPRQFWRMLTKIQRELEEGRERPQARPGADET